MFWLDVPAEVAFARKDDVPSIEYLEARMAVYRRLARTYGMSRVVATDPPDRLCRSTWRRIAALRGGPAQKASSGGGHGSE